MLIGKTVVSAIIPALLLAAASSVQARNADPVELCVFEKYAVASVAPFRTEENFGYGTYTRLRGAQLYVPAREGLTAEWLTLSVQQSLAKQSGTPSCQPAVANVSVQVVSAGSGFWVQLGAADERSAEALLRWARSIVPAKRVAANVQ